MFSILKINARLKRSKFLPALLLVCFGVLSGFSPVLHNHELELDHNHNDCGACQWSQWNSLIHAVASQGTPSPMLEILRHVHISVVLPKFLASVSSRSPPAVS